MVCTHWNMTLARHWEGRTLHNILLVQSHPIFCCLNQFKFSDILIVSFNTTRPDDKAAKQLETRIHNTSVHGQQIHSKYPEYYQDTMRTTYAVSVKQLVFEFSSVPYLKSIVEFRCVWACVLSQSAERIGEEDKEFT